MRRILTLGFVFVLSLALAAPVLAEGSIVHTVQPGENLFRMLHGTYWHSNFGQPMSHGCINLPTPEARWLFNWASMGTLINIHY